MSRKFKVKDKVRVKRGSMRYEQGIGTIVKVDRGDTDMPYLVKWPNGLQVWEYTEDVVAARKANSKIK